MMALDWIEHGLSTDVHRGAYISTTDPALDSDNLVAAGKLWVDTHVGPPYTLRVRNTDNTLWYSVGTSGAGDDIIVQSLLLDGHGDAIPLGAAGDLVFGFAATIVGFVAQVILPESFSTGDYLDLDFWRDSFANWPPTEDDTITGISIFTDEPNGILLQSGTGVVPVVIKGSFSDFVDWTTVIHAGDVIRTVVRRNNGASMALVTFAVRRTA
jgi:hypothetical protein